MSMTPLPSHEAFETMLRPRRATEEGILDNYPPWVCISFTAPWCGPCKRIDKPAIVEATPGIVWYVCDVDKNNTTLGYCGLRSIPSFCLIKDGTFKDRKIASSVDDVLGWLKENGAV